MTCERGPQTTFVYTASGEQVGCVVGGALKPGDDYRFWSASIAQNSEVYADRKGGYRITQGNSPVRHAWARPSGQRRRYVASSGDVFLRINASRWNIYRSGHRFAYTRGRDGVAAALAFVTWGGLMYPD